MKERIPWCREIIRLAGLKCSDNKISKIVGSTRSTVKKIRLAFDRSKLSWNDIADWDDGRIYSELFPSKARKPRREKPDLSSVHDQLAKGKTRNDLYDDYRKRCAEKKVRSMGYRSFCKEIHEKERTCRATKDMSLMPGRVHVRWLTNKYELVDEYGEIHNINIFFGFIPYSQVPFLHASEGKTKNEWLEAHVRMMNELECVPAEIYAVKCASGFIRDEFKREYLELIEHYNLIAVKDEDSTPYVDEIKEAIEWFDLQLSGQDFHSLGQLNDYLAKISSLYMDKEVYPGMTRKKVFQIYEKPYYGSLPEKAFVLKERIDKKILFNCHVKYENHYYSVPWKYSLRPDNTVSLEVTRDTISIYHNGVCIARHPNISDTNVRYSTHVTDMPSAEEEKQLEWNSNRFCRYAARIGSNTESVIKSLLCANSIVQKSYVQCRAILMLEKQYGSYMLEEACREYLLMPQGAPYGMIKNILGKQKFTPAVFDQDDGGF